MSGFSPPTNKEASCIPIEDPLPLAVLKFPPDAHAPTPLIAPLTTLVVELYQT